ncbi:hypothetical protein GCM10010329_20070 [Streptomyces spiroverticillatus]|uniref:Uncharacterized protein n=1 Tax=Streptomyces finlayi TaxID=67296 RepID=A0A919C8C3_9ACTN|nr:hypothetical protein [Streptomyces finlayi]GGZ98539.1 hypothetical protein GCM10010329_20070 [Streptomyces spiroverticillatus]GHC83402.1 hypothetical protein GCM10010334_12510 [Streptomyces finlayi]
MSVDAFPSGEGLAEGFVVRSADEEDGSGYVSWIADRMERVQLGMGAETLVLAQPLLADPSASETELRRTGVRLSECLADALRVAESRGGRLRMQGQ